MDKYIPGIAAIVGGICTVIVAILGFFLKGKFDDADDVEAKVAELDKAQAVMAASNKYRDERLEEALSKIDGIDGKLDTLLRRTPPRGMAATLPGIGRD